jgi:high-affinity K+ transport system ATPase subunit B
MNSELNDEECDATKMIVVMSLGKYLLFTQTAVRVFNR